MSINQVNYILSILTILSQIFIVGAIIYLIFFRKIKNKFINFVTRHALVLVFFIALLATSGSLYYSQIAGFAPCELCWFQRICMYPLVIIFGLAAIKKDNSVIEYGLGLVIIGTIIALYHNYIYYTAVTSSGFCSIVAPCTQKYITGFSYLSIPLMALSAFLIIGLLLMNKR